MISHKQTKVEPIKCFKVLLLPNLEEDFHGVAIVLDLCESPKIPFNFIPFPCLDLILKVFHIKVKARLLLQPRIQEDQLCKRAER